MSQYSTGLSSVTNGSPTVTGSGTLWLANVTAGDSFTVAGDGVMYDVASVDSDTQITLSVNYAGVTAAGAVYAIGTGFTVPDSFPEMSQGDIETATIFTRAMRKIQSRFTAIVSDISERPVTSSGTWTPTISSETNMTGVSFDSSEYTKIGDMVFAQLKGSFSVTSAEELRTLFVFTLPVNTLTDYTIIGGGGRLKAPSNMEINPAIGDPDSGNSTQGFLTFISHETGIHAFEIAIMYRGA